MKTRTGVASILLRVTRGSYEVLLLRRATQPFYGEWFAIEGGLQPGEQAHEAALREILEETRLVPERLYRETPLPRVVPSVGYEVLLSIFVAFVAPDAEVTLNEEHSDYQWLQIAQAIGRVPLPAQKATLRRIESTFVLGVPPEQLRVL